MIRIVPIPASGKTIKVGETLAVLGKFQMSLLLWFCFSTPHLRHFSSPLPSVPGKRLSPHKQHHPQHPSLTWLFCRESGEPSLSRLLVRSLWLLEFCLSLTDILRGRQSCLFSALLKDKQQVYQHRLGEDRQASDGQRKSLLRYRAKAISGQSF